MRTITVNICWEKKTKRCQILSVSGVWEHDLLVGGQQSVDRSNAQYFMNNDNFLRKQSKVLVSLPLDEGSDI